MTGFLTILFDGVAYGMLLFVLACGLAVTLGLMNFVNLAHGAFAMAGGYVWGVLVKKYGWAFFFQPSAGLFPQPLDRRAVRTGAVPASLCAKSSRPGAVLDRPGLHVGRS